MHKIRVEKTRDGHRSDCSEGDFVSNEYGTAAQAYQVGLRHKEQKDGDPNVGHKDLG